MMRTGGMNIWRIAGDQQSGEVRGAPQRMAMPTDYAGLFNVAAGSGNIVYSSASMSMHLAVANVDPSKGWETGPVREITHGSLLASHPSPSPDGQWIAFRLEGRQEDSCLVRADGSGLQQLTDLPGVDPYRPSFSPDGKFMAAYGPAGSLIFALGKERLTLEDAITPQAPGRSPVLLNSWSPVGKRSKKAIFWTCDPVFKSPLTGAPSTSSR
jgi:hypothetical protein